MVSSILSCFKRECGVSLETLLWKRASSRVEGRISWVSRVAAGHVEFLLRGDADFRDPLMLPQESQVSIRVARGLLGVLCSRCRGIGPHLELRPEPQGSSSVLTWISGFLWSFNRGVRLRLVWRHGIQLPSRGVKEVSGFLSSGHRVLGLFLEVPWGCHPSLHVLSLSSGFQSSPCRGIRLIWSGWGNRGLFELRHDSWGCA